MAGKPVGEIDAHIGRRIRHRRNMLNITQTELGQALGVTFQQIQKYEYGRNRVSVGTLLRCVGRLGWGDGGGGLGRLFSFRREQLLAGGPDLALGADIFVKRGSADAKLLT
jgi:transcriptional regulator with XRE-family HTH domain